MARSKEQQQMERANKETNTETSRPLTTFQSASFLSRALFLWPYPLLKIGLSRTIQEDDLPDILEPETSAANLKHMDELWKKAQLHSASKHGGQTERLCLHKIIVVDFLKDLWCVHASVHSMCLLKNWGLTCNVYCSKWQVYSDSSADRSSSKGYSVCSSGSSNTVFLWRNRLQRRVSLGFCFSILWYCHSFWAPS